MNVVIMDANKKYLICPQLFKGKALSCKKKVKRILGLILLAVVLLWIYSCQSMHVVTAHNVPRFSKARQFEGTVSASTSGLSANFAYNPIKHLSLQTSGFAYQNLSNAKYYNLYGEVEMGTYFNSKKLSCHFNLGYGYGQCNWNDWQLGKLKLYDITFAKFNTQSAFVHLFLHFKPDSSGKSSKGLSLKMGNYKDNYSFAHFTNGMQKTDFSNRLAFYEACFFGKEKIKKRLWITGGTGIAFVPDANSLLETISNFTYLGFALQF